MRQTIGNGWAIHHLTDRVVELRKDSADYRRLTGRDGFVIVRGEPGMPRAVLIDHAVKQANDLDDELARRIAAEQIPTAAALSHYSHRVQRLRPAFATPEDQAVIGRKAVG
jgi:hypothetical protein